MMNGRKWVKRWVEGRRGNVEKSWQGEGMWRMRKKAKAKRLSLAFPEDMLQKVPNGVSPLWDGDWRRNLDGRHLRGKAPPFAQRLRQALGNWHCIAASQAPRCGTREAHEHEPGLDIRGHILWYILRTEFRRRLDPLQPWTRRRQERDEIRVRVPHDQPSHPIKPAPRRQIPMKRRGEERAAGCVLQERGGRRSVGEGDVQLDERERVLHGHNIRHCRRRVPRGIGRGAVDEDKVKGGDTGCEVADDGGDALAWDSEPLSFVATETGEELVTVRIGGGVLDEFCALGGVLPLIAVVHRDGEGAAGLGEVLMDVRDPSESAYEGCIRAADMGNVFDVGVGGDPEVAEDDRENYF
ncbi:hypothetical protein FB451DRAFT_594900 [Mycena latifolia]|nr:hypothetical protein FB451DRAFT_594900 [Mycena latifolia]